MSQRERLIRAMIDTPDLEGAFRYDAEFHAQVMVISDMLPIILRGLYDEAARRNQRGSRAYTKYRDIPAMYTNEEIEELRIKVQTPVQPKDRDDMSLGETRVKDGDA